MAQHGFVLAATRSGDGKTTIASGIMAALIRRGLVVQPYKVGPDYIDPAFHTGICQRPSINLDTWMVSGDLVKWSYHWYGSDADAAVVEGVMGLFDGGEDPRRTGSTAEVAARLQLPVVLIIDAAKMAGSAAALVSGYAGFYPGVQVRAVIANRVASTRHYRRVKDAIESHTGIPVIGGILRDEHLSIPERHLGLTPVSEYGAISAWNERVGQVIESSLDLDQLLELTRNETLPPQLSMTEQLELTPGRRIKIAVARDEAFHFYYEDNLRLLAALGAEIIEFSPIHDPQLPPEVRGLYIGGGFPEMYIDQLAANQSMHRSIREAYQRGMPMIAECGGLVYLAQSFTAEKQYPLVGLVPADIRIGSRLAAMGYRRAVFGQSTVLGPAGMTLRGHEFHYTYAQSPGGEAVQLFDSGGREITNDSYASKNLFASYMHFHFFSNPSALTSFLAAARE